LSHPDSLAPSRFISSFMTTEDGAYFHRPQSTPR
jgi:hypothetical protein